MYIIFLTGASGVGKTTLVNAIAKEVSKATCLHFDSIKIPSEEKMTEQYGSPSQWQKAMTYQWIKKIVEEYSQDKLVIFEGQVNIELINENMDNWANFLKKQAKQKNVFILDNSNNVLREIVTILKINFIDDYVN